MDDFSNKLRGKSIFLRQNPICPLNRDLLNVHNEKQVHTNEVVNLLLKIFKIERPTPSGIRLFSEDLI
ncbi:hypothetical protein CSC82_04610 [Rhodobacteraceae bacterium 4F10]|nr:hypothetical protein CSC82_04610 [Rhodobacteraceae bacterium 4F10]